MDDRTFGLIAAFAQLDPSPKVTAVLMEFAQFDKRLVRYMAGPVIVHRSPWAETLPDWMIPAIYADRSEQINIEANEGIVGELATPLEVVAYMYPATMDAPMSYEWTQTYLYCGQIALTKHEKIPSGMTFAQVVLNEDQPLELTDYFRSQYLIPLQRDIRRKVIQVAAERGVAKQQQPVDDSTDDQIADDKPHQMRLFDLGA